uniref:O-fucosyltransferase family protein n=1 Tax=Leersia perrieri TaxID=77586 RepID=A0A0D9V7M8_9ORYZ
MPCAPSPSPPGLDAEPRVQSAGERGRRRGRAVAAVFAAAGKEVAGAGRAGGVVRRAARVVLAALLRRQAVFLFAPLLYVAAMLLYMGSISLDSVPRIISRPAPGSLYHSPQLYARLRADMDADNATDALATVWRHAYKGGIWRPCINNNTYDLPESNGYIYVEANGGLNQQRTSICNAVAVAGFLNATLVIPNFHYHSIWRDPSKFSDIYDEDHFVQRLKNDVRIVDKVPEFIMERFGHNLSNDMVAFSCCVFDGGEEEKEELDAARERGWRGKFTRPGRVIRPGAIRMNGKCPLTPLEVGLMLRGMGFSNNTAIYLASGRIYKAEKNMAPLLEMFPLLQTKETLASDEELAPFKNFSSRMAAIDYSVCVHSEVFVTTQGGNFPHFLLGHRRYLYGGHSKTIKPDKRRLAILFDSPRIGWKSLKRQLVNMRTHSDAKGIEMKRANESIYTFPCPDCMCRSNKSEHTQSIPAR